MENYNFRHLEKEYEYNNIYRCFWRNEYAYIPFLRYYMFMHNLHQCKNNWRVIVKVLKRWYADDWQLKKGTKLLLSDEKFSWFKNTLLNHL